MLILRPSIGLEVCDEMHAVCNDVNDFLQSLKVDFLAKTASRWRAGR